MDVEALDALRRAGTPHRVLDVREPWEVEICAIDGALHVPLADLPGRLDELPADRPIVVLCHHGGRSARAVGFLRSKGFASAVNLGGGIDAWALRVDRAMARYD